MYRSVLAYRDTPHGTVLCIIPASIVNNLTYFTTGTDTIINVGVVIGKGHKLIVYEVSMCTMHCRKSGSYAQHFKANGVFPVDVFIRTGHLPDLFNTGAGGVLRISRPCEIFQIRKL